MKAFWIKCVNAALVVCLLTGYNLILQSREKQEEVDRLYAELEGANWTIDNLQSEIDWLKNSKTSGSGDQQEKEAEENGLYQDGTYTGEAEGFGGVISVSVTIAGGQISQINILSADKEDGAYLAMAEEMIPVIIEKQSAQVDTVSGATFSSGGIKNAVLQALEKAAN